MKLGVRNTQGGWRQVREEQSSSPSSLVGVSLQSFQPPVSVARAQRLLGILTGALPGSLR